MNKLSKRTFDALKLFAEYSRWDLNPYDRDLTEPSILKAISQEVLDVLEQQKSAVEYYRELLAKMKQEGTPAEPPPGFHWKGYPVYFDECDDRNKQVISMNGVKVTIEMDSDRLKSYK